MSSELFGSDGYELDEACGLHLDAEDQVSAAPSK
jgi:hypothetical protein